MARTSTMKLLSARQKSCAELMEAQREAIGRTAEKLDGEFGAGTGEMARGLSERIFAQLAARNEALFQASVKLDTERIAHDSARQKKASLAETCRQTLIPAREVLTLFYGEEFAKSLGFEGRLSEDPQRLLGIAEHVRGRAAEVVPPQNRLGEIAPDLAEVTPEPVEISRKLAQPTERLAAALWNAALAQRQEESALVDRNAVVARFDRSFKLAANLLSLLFEAAGEPRSAQQMRPSGRRPGTLHVHARRKRRQAQSPEADSPKTDPADESGER